MDVDKVRKRVVARTQYEIPRGKLIQILSIGSAPITVEEAVRSRAPYLRGRITSGTGLALAPHASAQSSEPQGAKRPTTPRHRARGAQTYSNNLWRAVVTERDGGPTRRPVTHTVRYGELAPSSFSQAVECSLAEPVRLRVSSQVPRRYS